MLKNNLILICLLGLFIFFITNCQMYTKEEVDDLINNLKEDYQKKPIAWGYITFDAIISSGSGNFSVTHSAAGVYTIDINGVNLSGYNYNVTIAICSIPPCYATWVVSASDLIIRSFDSSGSAVNANFSFTVSNN
ncbi:MAG: hypothetical protein JXB50_09430 [Spirochaetes bacterium]|nr:hypothetical protein [Spirochaetota bacterium]